MADDSKYVVLRGLAQLWIHGADFKIVITQDADHHVITIDVATDDNHVMSPIPIRAAGLKLDKDKQYQTLRLRAKEK